jgi:integrase
MPRQAKLTRKNGFWYSQAGNRNGVYFGRCDEVSRRDASKVFHEHLSNLDLKTVQNSIACAELFDLFIDAVQERRSPRTYSERKLHLNRFANHKRAGILIGQLAPTSITSDDMGTFLDHAKKDYALDEFTAHKHFISVVACFNWGAGIGKLKNPNPCLPAGFRPFANMERYKAPAKPLLEDELPTTDEVNALFTWADADIELVKEKGRYRSRKSHERREGKENPYVGFGDILRVYYHTGARTSELANCDVRDFIRNGRQIVLGRHKRERTTRDPMPRRITLNDESFGIVTKWCEEKDLGEPIFTDPLGRRWTRHTLGTRFQQIRKLAEVRDNLTIYSFRHLWISEALIHDGNIARVAKMAGTSVAMIEKVYGHFTNRAFQEVQSKLDQARASAA